MEGELIIAKIVEEHKKLLLDFFNNVDGKDDANYTYKEDQKEFLLFLVCNDQTSTKSPFARAQSNAEFNGNDYVKLFPLIEIPKVTNPELIFFKVLKNSLKDILLNRLHVQDIIAKYQFNFILVGSIVTGIFIPFHSIYTDYRVVEKDHQFVYGGWYRFQPFEAFTVICFCEHIFSVSILNRNCSSYFKWVVMHPISSGLIPWSHRTGIYGIQGDIAKDQKGLTDEQRSHIKDYIGNTLYDIQFPNKKINLKNV